MTFGGVDMMYPFMTLNDETEIVHSEMKRDGRVKVYIENRTKKTVSITRRAGFRIIRGRMLRALMPPTFRGIVRSSYHVPIK